MIKGMIRGPLQRTGGWCEPAGAPGLSAFGAVNDELKVCTLYRTFEWPVKLPAIWVATRFLPSHGFMWVGGFFYLLSRCRQNIFNILFDKTLCHR